MKRRALSALIVLALAGSLAATGQAQDAAPVDALALAREFQSLLEEYVTLPAPPIRATREQIQRWRGDLEPKLDSLIQRLDSLTQRMGDSPDVLLVLALSHAKRANLLLERRRELDAEWATGSDGDPDRARLARERSEMAARVADEYRLIRETLSSALESADTLRNERQIGLVHGVVLAQSAIVEGRAIDSAHDAGETRRFDPDSQRRLLDDAQRLLLAYLDSTPQENGLEWVRGQFYLGVVEYRRSLKKRTPGKEYFTEVDPSQMRAFERARDIFTKLSDTDAVLAILHPRENEAEQAESAAGRAYDTSSFRLQSGYSYEAVAQYYAASSNLYLGLIAAIDPQFDQQPEARFDAARQYLDKANTLDMAAPGPDQPEISLTSETIPTSHDKVLHELKIAMETPQRRPLNDFTFTIGGAYLYDTNVILLGKHTDPPRDKHRSRDSRGSALLRFNYVADLDVLRPNDDFLRRWQVFAEGRVSSTWNARIHDFNEQFFGGTINLRYELVGPGVIENLDGAYFHARYDFDKIHLGNEDFLTIHRIRPMLQFVGFDSVVDASLYFSYENRNYSEELNDPRFDRDGNYFAAGMDWRFDLGKWVDAESLWGEKYAWGGAAPRKDDADYIRPLEFALGYEVTSNSTQGDEFDYSSQILSSGLVFPLPLGVDFSFTGSWEWQNYHQFSLIDRQRRFRHNFVQEYGFRAERRFFLTDYDADFEYVRPLRFDRIIMTVYGDIRFVLDDSNTIDSAGQRLFEYDRVIYGLGVRLDFN